MLIPVVLSGGAGTRLWPVSREGQPKPFMRLPDGQTLLGKTYRRAAGLLAGHGEIVTVTNREHYFQSKDQFQAPVPACGRCRVKDSRSRSCACPMARPCWARPTDVPPGSWPGMAKSSR